MQATRFVTIDYGFKRLVFLDWAMVTRAQSITVLRPTLTLVALACSMCARAVLGGEFVRPTLELNDLRVVVTHLSTVELANLQRTHGVRINARDIRKGNRHGFTILKRNLKTGELTCEIYLPSDRRPRLVDDEATLTLGHEFLHCLLGEYHP